MSHLEPRYSLCALLFAAAACVGSAELSGPPGNTMTPVVNTPADAATSTPDASSVEPGDAGTPAPDAGSSTVDAGPTNPCANVTCASGSHCALGACVCNPGFIADAGQCYAGDPGVPALRSQEQVCAAYRAGMISLDQDPFSKTTATCDPGVLTRQGLDDALTRLNMHRYLAGLAPTTDSMTSNTNAQACALISAWNPAGQAAHSPPPTATCYTQGGAGAAGSSNIAWGCRSPADAIDQWMIDYGNDTTFGHRRWFMNPPLGPVGFGYYEGGNNYGSASCIVVFGSGTQGPRPAVIAYPPAGFVPVALTQWAWTAQGDVPFRDAGIVITTSDGGTLAARVVPLEGNYGSSGAVRIDRTGNWQPRPGEIYSVTLTGEGHAPVQWDVKPVTCP